MMVGREKWRIGSKIDVNVGVCSIIFVAGSNF